MITERDVRTAEYLVDEAGLVDILLDGRQRSTRGRKTNRNHYRLFLIGGLLNVPENGNLVVASIHHTLTRDLSLDLQLHLGVRTAVEEPDGTITWEVLDIEDLYRVTKTLSNALNYGAGSAPDLDDEERTRRHDVIRHFGDSLMDVFDLGWNTSTFAMDATGMWAWGKGKRVKDPEDTGATPDTDTDQLHEQPDPTHGDLEADDDADGHGVAA